MGLIWEGVVFSGVDTETASDGDDSGNGDTDGNVSYLVRTGQGGPHHGQSRRALPGVP